MVGFARGGPPTEAEVLRVVAETRDAVGRVRGALLAAGAGGWVSSAATAYEALLGDALTDVARVAAAVDASEGAVLRHVRAAATARAAAAHEEAARRAEVGAMLDDAVAIGTGRAPGGWAPGGRGAGGAG